MVIQDEADEAARRTDCRSAEWNNERKFSFFFLFSNRFFTRFDRL